LVLRVAAFALLATGCVLVVAPDRFGDRCRFAGETSQCGACLVEHCRAEIDGACGDDATLAAVESCAEAHDCAAATAATAATAAGTSAVSSCLARSCAAVCRTLAGPSTTACREPATGVGATCTCTHAAPTNDVICDTKAYPSTLCCAPAGWPAEGLTCTCDAMTCVGTSDGCSCGLLASAPDNPTCRTGFCCVDKEACRCRAKPCYDFETPVPSCSIDVVSCKLGQVRVESCSLR
jgi:hypothetical protein